MNKMNLSKDIINRFWSKVNKIDGECWLWTAGLSGNGYGIFFYDGIRVSPHRFVWEYFYGVIPPNKVIQHHCDNKLCCNPSHLFLGTPKTNSQDMVNKGRQKGGWAPGAQHANTDLTDNDVREIKQRLKNGEFQSIIAEDFGITQTSVSRIKLGKTWSHVQI